MRIELTIENGKSATSKNPIVSMYYKSILTSFNDSRYISKEDVSDLIQNLKESLKRLELYLKENQTE